MLNSAEYKLAAIVGLHDGAGCCARESYARSVECRRHVAATPVTAAPCIGTKVANVPAPTIAVGANQAEHRCRGRARIKVSRVHQAAARVLIDHKRVIAGVLDSGTRLPRTRTIDRSIAGIGIRTGPYRPICHRPMPLHRRQNHKRLGRRPQPLAHGESQPHLASLQPHADPGESQPLSELGESQPQPSFRPSDGAQSQPRPRRSQPACSLVLVPRLPRSWPASPDS